MAEPYRIVLTGDLERSVPEPFGPSSGIVIEYTQRRRILSVHGWFDHFVGIEGSTLTLAELIRQLHIPPAHVRAALKEIEHGEV